MQDHYKEIVFQLENQAFEKNNLIQQLKKELYKYYKEDFNSTKEIIICDPDKINLEMNNELCEARNLITKYNSIIQEQKKQINSMESRISKYKEALMNKSKGKRVMRTIENIERFRYLLSLSSDDDDKDSKNSIENSFRNEQLDYSNNDRLSIDSPIENLPEKIKMIKTLTTETQEEIPKLDFSTVLKKYHSIKENEIVEGKKQSPNYKDDEYIDKLRFQLKINKETILNYQKKVKEMKKIITILKQYVNNQNNKPTSLGSTTDDTKPNRTKDYTNESMNNNISVVFDENEITVEEEYDFSFNTKVNKN